MSCDLKSLLPGVVSGISGVREILDTIALEMDRVKRSAEEEYRQFAATTASTRLSDWERELALYSRPDLDTQSRRALILAALSFFSPCTPQSLMSLYSKMTGGVASYAERPLEYRIDLSTEMRGHIVPDLAGIYASISKVAPAHIYCFLSADGDLENETRALNTLHAMTALEVFTDGYLPGR